jgi:hypothetical protein
VNQRQCGKFTFRVLLVLSIEVDTRYVRFPRIENSLLKLSLITIGILVFTSVATFASTLLNSPKSGYLLCINKITKVATFPNTQSCLPGFKEIILGAQGEQGIPGVPGVVGPQGPGGSGPQGPSGALNLYDSTGNLIGQVTSETSYEVDARLSSGIVVGFDRTNGYHNVFSTGSPVYLDSACRGTMYAFANMGLKYDASYPFIYYPERTFWNGNDYSDTVTAFTVGVSSGPQILLPARNAGMYTSRFDLTTQSYSCQTGSWAETDTVQAVTPITTINIPQTLGPTYQIR